ncbi:hypothetical protein L226DRAFT_530981 [Lentinus tigrinus ALCF2SS1-7]|uniref:uncharacterized protein n=1 Tax=Lentinus tigrinus ALCF2SS1-7 TaxID=1328758 RepID=UPI0011662025|nr:hypothetical protein L226DRAFT_530981 [Lentinus tigrinus ALCF2SS1-7]
MRDLPSSLTSFYIADVHLLPQKCGFSHPRAFHLKSEELALGPPHRFSDAARTLADLQDYRTQKDTYDLCP